MKNTKAKSIRVAVISGAAIIAYSVAIGIVGGCGSTAVPAASASPDASASPSPSPTATASPSPTPPPVIFTSDSFDSVGGRTTWADGTNTDALVGGAGNGGIAKAWHIGTGQTSTWSIAAGFGLLQAWSGSPQSIFVQIGSGAPQTCTVKMNLAVTPAANKLAGIAFRASIAASQLFALVYDNGSLGTAGYKVVYANSSMPVPQSLPTALPTSATSNDELKVVVTTRGSTATVTPSGGTAVSSSYVADENLNSNFYVGIMTDDSASRFDNFVIQDCQ